MEAPYSLEEYIWLRGEHLRTQPRFAYVGDAVYSRVRQEVTALFPHNTEDIIPTATAAQISAMEAMNGMDPLTPLPPRMIPMSSPLPAAALPSPVSSTPPRFSTPEPPTAVLKATDRENARDPMVSPASPAPGPLLQQSAHEMQADLPQALEQMPWPLPDKIEQGDVSVTTAQNVSPAVPPAIPRPPKTVPAPGVQAMSNRPVHNPVKVSTRGRRDLKKINYAQFPVLDEDIEEGPDDKLKDMHPSKKARKTAAKQPRNAAKDSASKDPKRSSEEPKAKKNSRQAGSSDKKPMSTVLTLAQIPASTRFDPAFNDVVNGLALPHNRDQARYAQGMRKHLLMAEYEHSGAYARDKAAHEVAHKPKKGKKKANTPLPEFKPDLMPEFFEASNFGKGEDEMRCICDSNEDHEEHDWIACDTCNAWQHDGCMGEAVPANKKHRYYCHVCDPYGHRVLLQHVRQAHAV